MPRLIRTITPRYMVTVGFIVHRLACLVMVHWYLGYPYKDILLTRLFEIVGLAWLMVPINVMSFGFLPKHKITSGSGLLSLARNFGASCGVSSAATVLARRSQVHQNMLVSHLTPTDFSYHMATSQRAQWLFHHGLSLPDATMAANALVGRELQRQSMMLSYVDPFWILAAGSFLAAPLPLLARRPRAVITASQIKEADHGE
jgi:DHA2 family multidrug resistance protein